MEKIPHPAIGAKALPTPPTTAGTVTARERLYRWAKRYMNDPTRANDPTWDAVWRVIAAEIERQNAGQPVLEVEDQ